MQFISPSKFLFVLKSWILKLEAAPALEEALQSFRARRESFFCFCLSTKAVKFATKIIGWKSTLENRGS